MPDWENDLRRFRVDVDIKLDRRLPVTQHHRTAHYHDAGNFGMQFRVAVEQQGDVGLRAGCDDGDRLGAVAQGLAISSTAVNVWAAKPGSGSAGPSRPLSPCTLSAIISSRING